MTGLNRLLVTIGFVGVSLLNNGSCAAQAAKQAMAMIANTSNEFLAPGDAIRLTFWREPDLNGDYQIDERGFAVLPLLGLTNVVEFRTLALKELLMEEFGRELRNQGVQITMLRRIRIMGAVNQPGLYRVDPTMTFGDAVALAGGVTPAGRMNRIEVYRGAQRMDAPIDLGAVIVGQLQSGDQITVPERNWLSRNSVFLLGALISATAIVVSRAAF